MPLFYFIKRVGDATVFGKHFIMISFLFQVASIDCVNFDADAFLISP